MTNEKKYGRVTYNFQKELHLQFTYKSFSCFGFIFNLFSLISDDNLLSYTSTLSVGLSASLNLNA